ncbi:MAG: radical SAM protein [Candidatus Bathyarchaeia archaeon]
MIIREISARTVLSKSQVHDSTINPYVGCEHGCAYCYARFIKRFTGHREAWGEFLDVKVNAPTLLEREASARRRGRVWISGVCDPYQPAEKVYGLTRRCLKILTEHRWPITVQTKSPTILRDLDLLEKAPGLEVGFTVTTADERVRMIFEPKAPPIDSRIRALEELHLSGIRSFAMIAPLLPNAFDLIPMLAGIVDYVLIDKMNYHYSDMLYREHGFEYALKDDYFKKEGARLAEALLKKEVPCQMLF